MRPDDPACHNSARPHHPVAAHLHADYTYAFALVSRQPHRGRLPGQLAPPFALLALMQQQLIEGPERQPAWRRPDDHLSTHQTQLRDLQEVHLQVLRCSKAALDALRQRGDSPQLQESEAERARREDLVRRDVHVGYLTFPETLLSALINVLIAERVTRQPQVSDSRRCFHLVLVYPQREAHHLNVNLTYKGHIQRNGARVVYTALAGYHLGTSDTFSNAGRPLPAVYLGSRLAATTVFGDTVNSLTEPFRAGLMTVLRPGEEPAT